MAYRYPADTLDNKYQLLSLLGDFWEKVHAESELISNILFAVAQEERQTQQNYKELSALVSRYTAPVWHTELWYNWIIKASDLSNQPLRYGDPTVYGQGAVYGGRTSQIGLRLPVPTGLTYVPVIANRITDPAVIWTADIDFKIEDGYIVFARNPFDTADFAQVPIVDSSGTQTDTELSLWLMNSAWDRNYLYNYYGYLLGNAQTSSPEYKELINAALDGFTLGTCQEVLSRVLGVLTDSPVARGAEIVVDIASDSRYLLVVTDQNVYRYPQSVTAVVNIGDSVYDGQELVNTVKFYDLAVGEVPDVTEVQIAKEFLPATYCGGLSFPNRDVPLVVTEDVDSRTKVEFEIAGYSTDVTRFFNEMHEKAISGGTYTLAELLDVRGLSAPTQPTAASLPATINPARFLVENVLRFNFMFAKITLTNDYPASLSLSEASLLRKLVPPWSLLLLHIEIPFGSDIFPGDQAGTADSPGFSDSLDVYSALDALTVTINPALFTDTLEFHYVECLCE